MNVSDNIFFCSLAYEIDIYLVTVIFMFSRVNINIEKNMFKVNDKDTRKTSMIHFGTDLLIVSINEFEQVNTLWICD